MVTPVGFIHIEISNNYDQIKFVVKLPNDISNKIFQRCNKLIFFVEMDSKQIDAKHGRRAHSAAEEQVKVKSFLAMYYLPISNARWTQQKLKA